jgi:thiosulfate/3-mercaptopyruvate sulfurtransferase
MFRTMLSIGLALGLWLGMIGQPAQSADWRKLAEPAELAALMARRDVILLDIRTPAEYAKGHLTGALSAPYGSWRGPKDNPGLELSDAALTARMQSLGLTRASRVVITYAGADSTDFGAAARVYWTLKSAGLTEIAILNGGITAWKAAGRGLSPVKSEAVPSDAVFTLSRDWLIDRAGVEAVLKGERASVMVDARPSDFFRGQKKHPAASRPGTLPSSLSLPEGTWFDQSKTQISTAERVTELAKAAGYSAESGGELVSFCNTGHWAATNWFALSEMAGVEGVKLYPESMVGWSKSGGELVNGQ